MDFIEGYFFSNNYPLVIKHGNGKSPRNGGLNGKITARWSIFHCHVLLPEGRAYKNWIGQLTWWRFHPVRPQNSRKYPIRTPPIFRVNPTWSCQQFSYWTWPVYRWFTYSRWWFCDFTVRKLLDYQRVHPNNDRKTYLSPSFEWFSHLCPWFFQCSSIRWLGKSNYLQPAPHCSYLLGIWMPLARSFHSLHSPLAGYRLFSNQCFHVGFSSGND